MGMRPLAAVIMAAGKGTRMKDPNRAKVMFEVLGQPMLHNVLELAYALHADRVLTIVGYQRETVEKFLRSEHPNAEVCVQAEQRGTGHAMMQTTKALERFTGDVVILSGDVPLLTAESMNNLLVHHRDSNAGATILTAEFEDPSGYGRIIRNADGSVQKIVEHKDANDAERNIREINSGIYVIDREKLTDGLGHIAPHNVQNEYYLTDIFEYFWKHEWRVSALKAAHPDEIRGINTIEQLAEAEAVLKARKAN
jgi:UDP-N-acetylglucosamine diphosphorylase/glucosamine-1-phosphate N-acetyltransferase